MIRPGRRTFFAASLPLLLVGIIHTIVHFTYRPSDPPLKAIESSMRSYRIPMGPVSPSLLDFWNSLSLTMSITLLWLGLLGIVLATSDASDSTLVYLAGCGASVLMYAAVHVLPPFVILAVAETLFALSLVQQAMGMGRPAAT